MILALLVFVLLVFVTLCVIGLLALVKQAITDPSISTPHAFMQDPMPPAATRSAAAGRASAADPSEDAERGPCGEGCT